MLVGDSYSGVLMREFLATNGKQKVVGMVIVDSAIERTPLPPDWPSLMGDSSYPEIEGLETKRVGLLSDEEWALIKADDEANGPTAAVKEKFIKESTEIVNAKIRGK